MKKLDLIQKLIKLATNNPNEHEANRAARKVCKLIVEENFLIVEGRKTEPFRPKPVEQPVTWNDVRRTTEPFWKSRPQEPSQSEEARAHQAKWNAIFEEIYKRRGQHGASWYDPRTSDFRSYDEEIKSNPFKEGAWSRPWVYDPVTGKNRQEPKPKRKLKCRRCGETKDTIFVGAEELYECNECIWNRYKEKI